MALRSGGDIRARLLESFPQLALIRENAFAVGGVIRDLLLGRPPVDVDLACREAERLARRFATATNGRLVDLGREHFKTFRVVTSDAEFDFSEVEGETIERDLGRRDMTINAIAVSLTGEPLLIDPHGGLDDLAAGVIRMIEEKNFLDDPLRILKCCRVACMLGFSIDSETAAAMSHNSALLSQIARERTAYELKTMFSGCHSSSALTLLAAHGLDAELFGRRSTDQQLSFAALLGRGELIEALALIFLEAGEREVSDWCSRQLVSTRECQHLRALLIAVRVSESRDSRELPVILAELGAEQSRRLADMLSATGRLDDAAAVRSLIRNNAECLFESRPLLDGRAISTITGVPPGPELGELSRELRRMQWRGELRNTAEAEAWLRGKGGLVP